MFIRVLSICFAFLLFGCATSGGVMISQEKASQFKKGVTTEKEIIAALGQPTSISMDSNGRMISYIGAEAQGRLINYIPIVGLFAGGIDSTSSAVTFFIGSNGVMKDSSYSQGASSHDNGLFSRKSTTDQTQTTTAMHIEPSKSIRKEFVVSTQSSSSSKGKEIICSPNIVRPGDTLTIKTNKEYSDLGVRVPDKKVNFVMLVADAYPEGLMDNSKFKSQMGIEVNVTSAKIMPHTKVFSKEGIYSFVISQNLETDNGTPAFECKVKFSLR